LSRSKRTWPICVVFAVVGHPQRVQISTTFQDNPVNLTATFKTIPSGLNHVAYAEVTVPSKQLSLHVQNFDYSRNS
jgi:hypothetical protein